MEVLQIVFSKSRTTQPGMKQESAARWNELPSDNGIELCDF